ncbi:hypothetical protein [Streptomyces lydicus]|uniref:hypothetical protein n=1 Tax=Streptomyces lydicus TaxID=47763 RepID=UPI0037AF2787
MLVGVALSQALTPGGQVCAQLLQELVGHVITRLGERAELPVRHTGHSARRGAAEESRHAGNDRKVIAKQGGWVPNSGVMEGYFEDADGWELLLELTDKRCPWK